MAYKKIPKPFSIPPLSGPGRHRRPPGAVVTQPVPPRLRPAHFPGMPGIGKLLAALPAAQALVRRNFLAQKRALFHGEEMPEGLVTGVSIGMRERGGRRTKEPCLIFHVPYKVPAKELKSRCVHHKLPGVPTDVVVGHPPRAHDAAAPADPLLCGQSFAHWKIGRGTAGCLVSRPGSADPTTRDLFVLSANHVLAACGECAVGDKIFNPSKDDGGEEPPNVWAELKTWVELDWTGVNTVDAALAWVTESMVSSMLANGMRYVAQVQPLGQRRRVFKFGAASGYTQGVLDSNYYGGQVEYVQPKTRTRPTSS